MIPRRDFITLLGGATAWPLAVRAQQRERMRHVGMLLSGMADDAAFQAWVGAFLQGLAQSGWIIGRNVQIVNRQGLCEAEGDNYAIRDGIVVIPDSAVVPDGTLI